MMKPDGSVHGGRSSRLLIILCSAICLVGIFDRDLWTPDEPRVAAVSLEMSRTGNVMVPHLAGRPFVEKPPLYFAVAAFAMRAAGPLVGNTGAARLTSALWGLGMLWVTFLLGRRLAGNGAGAMCLCALATMAGFVENTHWIRVDAALAFFVLAAVWSFGEAYFAERRRFLLPAGFFAAGAFLAKGVVGLALVAVAWLSMVVPWIVRRRRARRGLFIGHHLLCLGGCCMVVAGWLLAFKAVASPELWEEWFWRNQVGRLLGTAPELGHTRPDKLYYLKTVAVYTMPWLPFVLLWLWRVARDLVKTRRISPQNVFLLAWSAGTVLLLSLSATKRSLYLLPVLPALAVMCGGEWSGQAPRWCRIYLLAWCCVAVLSLAIFAALPAAGGLLADFRWQRAAEFLRTFGWRHAVAAMSAAVCVGLLLLRRVSLQRRAVAVTAVAYIGLILVAAQAVDREKSMKQEIASFAAGVPEERKARACSWYFSETMSGCFYYYCDWIVPGITRKHELVEVIGGRDPQFDSVVVSIEWEYDPPLAELVDVPHSVLAEGRPGATGHERELFWVTGPGGEDRREE